MNTVVVDGIPYTKAKEVSRKYHYTTDYLGQLCRVGKIDCQLVGRAWYINEKSVSSHKNNETQNTRNDEISFKDNNISSVEQFVTPRPRKQTIQPVPTSFLQKLTSKGELEQPTQYEGDDAELFPQPIMKKNSQLVNSASPTPNAYVAPVSRFRLITPIIPILSAEDVPSAPGLSAEDLESVPTPQKGSKLVISGTKKSHKIAFTKAPSVSLSGKVKITTIREPKFVEDSSILVEEFASPVTRITTPTVSSLRSSSRSGLPLPADKHKEDATLKFLPQSVTRKSTGRWSLEVGLLTFLAVVSAGFAGATVFLKTEVTISSDQVENRTLIQLPF